MGQIDPLQTCASPCERLKPLAKALQRYLALPSSGPKTIPAFKASIALSDKPDDPGVSEFFARKMAALREAGMPEK
jgi:hypothetical protein